MAFPTVEGHFDFAAKEQVINTLVKSYCAKHSVCK